VTIASGGGPCYDGVGRQYLLPKTAKIRRVAHQRRTVRDIGRRLGIPRHFGAANGSRFLRQASPRRALTLTEGHPGASMDGGSTAPKRPRVAPCAERPGIITERTSSLSMRYCSHEELLAGNW